MAQLASSEFSRFVSVASDRVAAVDAVGRYVSSDGSVSVVSSADIYEFDEQGLVATITSYAVELDASLTRIAAAQHADEAGHNVRMSPSLFVYGTLAPGRPNEHVLAEVPGDCEPAQVRGTLLDQGWGATLGFPAIELNVRGDVVDGFLLTSDALDQHWARLDAFEGEGYERVLTEVRLSNGRQANAFIYVNRPREDSRSTSAGGS
jgi:gamma-glutamylcyclotransferase (GGCT)/AIG2-like uncharacterized protein YtfP